MWIDFVVLTFILIIVVLAAIQIRAHILRQMAKDRRAKELREWARTNGFAYSATEALMSFRCEPFECLQKGDYCYSYNVMEGTSGNRRVRAFDYHYHYETHSPDGSGRPLVLGLIGRGKTHHYFSAVVIDAGIPLLPLSIRPRSLLDEVTEFIGFEETGFESAEFSQKFRVKSPDRRWAYDIVHQKTMELMLAHPDFRVDFMGSQVMAYYPDRVFSLEEFESALTVVTGILDNLPPDVVEQLKRIVTGGKRS